MSKIKEIDLRRSNFE